MGKLDVLSIIEDQIYQEIKKRLSNTRIRFQDLINAPSEFRAESLNDPLVFRSYQYFAMLKNAYKTPVALLILYIFEKKLGLRVKEMYFHDLIAGSPAWLEGYSGRDLDIIIVVDRKPDLDTIMKVEKYIDEIVCLSIWLFFKERGEVDDYKPFNKIIGHNLIELHVITEEEKEKFALEGGVEGPRIEKADLNELRDMVSKLEKETKTKDILAPLQRPKIGFILEI